MPKCLPPAIAGAIVVFALSAAPAIADDIDSLQQGCNLCHGQNGTPTDPTIPIIWGQQGSALYKELHDYHSGDRENPVMTLIAKGIMLPDLRKLADHFAAKTWPANPVASASGSLPESGNMCRACHGQKFEGGEPGPRLAGLSYYYLLAQMNAFADGSRTNNLDMPKFMRDLGPADRDAIAHYLAGL